jgi:hypothetical protein
MEEDAQRDMARKSLTRTTGLDSNDVDNMVKASMEKIKKAIKKSSQMSNFEKMVKYLDTCMNSSMYRSKILKGEQVITI